MYRDWILPLVCTAVACQFQPQNYEGVACRQGVCPSGLACVSEVCVSQSEPSGDVFRRPLTFNASALSENVSNFPLVVDLSGDWLRLTEEDASGRIPRTPIALAFEGMNDDLCNDTPPCSLPHEVELYDPAIGRVVAWVRVPTLPNRDGLVIDMIYGDVVAGSADTMWSDGFSVVSHLNGNYEDSSSNRNHGQALPSENPEPVDARIAGGMLFEIDDGAGDHLEIEPSMSLNEDIESSGQLSLEVWIRPAVSAVDYSGAATRIIDKWHGEEGGYGLMFSDDAQLVEFAVSNGVAIDFVSAPANFAADSWHHLVGVWSAGDIRIFLDGAQRAAETSDFLTLDTGSRVITIGGSGSTSRTFPGTIDELRISNVARSASWVDASFRNQSAPTPGGTGLLSTLGEETSLAQ